MVFIRLLLPLLGGIVCAAKIELPPTYWLFPLLTVSILLFIINLNYVKLSAYKHKAVIGICLCIMVFLLGGFLTSEKDPRNSKYYFALKRSNYLEVYVDEEPQKRSSGLVFKAVVVAVHTSKSKLNAEGNLMVTLKTGGKLANKIEYGDVLLLPSNYKEMRVQTNPAKFDYRSWLANKRIYHQCFIGIDRVKTIRHDGGNAFIKFLYRLRAQQVDFLKQALGDEASFTFLSALILGYRSDLDQSLMDIYSKTGTIHALSVSGMHVALIYILLSKLLFFLNRNASSRFVKVFTILTAIWFYALLTGFSPSVLRSSIMISVFIVGKLANRQPNGGDVLAFTAFMLLLYDPLYILDIGFQLSFLAVIGLIYLHPSILKWLSIKNVWLRKIWEAMSISISAQLTTFPLSAYYFHTFPNYFLVSNLFIAIPTALLMYLGILMIVLKLTFLAPVVSGLIWFNNKGLELISNLPGALVNKVWISLWQLMLLAFFLTTLVIGLKMLNKKYIFISLTLLLIFTLDVACESIITINQRNLIVVSSKKQRCVIFIEGNVATALTATGISDPYFKFNVQPIIDMHQATTRLIRLDTAEFKSGHLHLKNGKVIFFDNSIDLADIMGLKPKQDFVMVRNLK